MMLPPIQGPCEKLAALDISIGNSWSDEELVRFLAERKARDPLPGDVLVGVDCSVLDPWCTESIWCLKWSDHQEPYVSSENGIRKTKNGYWKPVVSSRIPTSTGIMGVKIILEFYEGYAPCGKKTRWMMHEYQVQKNNEANLPQDYKTLCRVCMQSDKNAETGPSSLNANAPKDSLESYLQYLARVEGPKDTVSGNEQDTFSSTGLHEQNAQSDADDIHDHDALALGDYIEMNDLLISSCIEHEQETGSSADDIAVRDNISTNDYIELNDLLHSEASSSTSENTSKRSMISEEYFDSDAFLKEILEDNNLPDGQHKNHKFSIAAPTKLANVVLGPTEQGLLPIHGVNAVAGPSQQQRVSGEDRDQHSSKESQQHSSSISFCFPSRHVKRSHSYSSDGSQSSMQSQGVRSTIKFGKIGKKYFCFRSL